MLSVPLPGQHQIVAAMLLHADTVLLCHRSSGRAWYPDVWDLPGGHMEPNETPEDALVRELQEELGVTLSVPLGGHAFTRATKEFEMRVWTSRRWSGTPANCAPQEHDQIGWFTEREVRPLRLADDVYRGWIAEALSSERSRTAPRSIAGDASPH
jgi:8-oxo-dGTP diphosphatase